MASASTLQVSAAAYRVGPRRAPRYPIKTEVELTWLAADGSQKTAVAKALDMSDTGIRVKLGEPLPFDSLIKISVRKLRLCGHAFVRHCARKGLFGYAIGLEFRGCLMPSNWNAW